MPIIDDERGVLVLRLVYDGPPRSGKTTTLRTLADSLSTGMVTPAEREGRTLYFDWVDYVGGLFEGRRIRCQIVSVPGQHELAARRQHILESADAVVLVADSRPEPFGEAMSILRNLLPWCRGRHPPTGIVVQANKRDVEGALSRNQVRDRLDGIAPIALTETVATSGEGVREAFVLGVRLALDRVRALSERGELPRGRPAIDDPDTLLAELKGLGAPARGWSEHPSARAEAEVVAEAEAEVVAEAEAEAGTGTGTGTGTEAEVVAGLGTVAGAVIAETVFAPDPMMPGGFIWPPVDGRTLLHEVARLRLVPEQNAHGDWSASGVAGAFTHARRRSTTT